MSIEKNSVSIDQTVDVTMQLTILQERISALHQRLDDALARIAALEARPNYALTTPWSPYYVPYTPAWLAGSPDYTQWQRNEAGGVASTVNA